MRRVRMHIATSLDGYVAGPGQGPADPLGVGGLRLHDWLFELESVQRAHGREGGERTASSRLLDDLQAGVGATVMGRNMFGGGPGPWGDPSWEGWWGDDPPYHHPVYVVTHHARAPLEMDGGTTFHFVTGGVAAAVEQAQDAAGDQDVAIGGGADVGRQALRAGLIDELTLHVVPILLGAGERLLDGVGDAPGRLRQSGVLQAPDVTHLTYEIER